MFDQPIVERKNTSPLATSLLVLSAIFLLGATVLTGMQIKAVTYRSAKPTDSAKVWQKDNQTSVINKIEEIVSK